MDSPKHVLDGYEIARALKELPSWRERMGTLVCAWSFATSREAVDFLAIVAEAAEHLGHHPDVDWRWNTIFLTTTSHDVGGEITPRDIELATLLEFAAADSGAIAVPHRHQDMTLAIDAQDPAKLEAFWSATMGYRKGRDGDLVDPGTPQPAAVVPGNPNAKRQQVPHRQACRPVGIRCRPRENASRGRRGRCNPRAALGRLHGPRRQPHVPVCRTRGPRRDLRRVAAVHARTCLNGKGRRVRTPSGMQTRRPG